MPHRQRLLSSIRGRGIPEGQGAPVQQQHEQSIDFQMFFFSRNTVFLSTGILLIDRSQESLRYVSMELKHNRALGIPARQMSSDSLGKPQNLQKSLSPSRRTRCTQLRMSRSTGLVRDEKRTDL